MNEWNSPEKGTGRILVERGTMEHIDLGRATPVREREAGCLCLRYLYLPLVGDVTKLTKRNSEIIKVHMYDLVKQIE